MIFQKQLFLLLVGLILPVALLGQDLPDGVSDECATQTTALSGNETIKAAADSIIATVNIVTGTASYSNTAPFEEACTDAGGSYVEKDVSFDCAGLELNLDDTPACMGTNCTEADQDLIIEAAVDIADDQCSTAATSSFILVSGAMLLLATTWSLL